MPGDPDGRAERAAGLDIPLTPGLRAVTAAPRRAGPLGAGASNDHATGVTPAGKLPFAGSRVAARTCAPRRASSATVREPVVPVAVRTRTVRDMPPLWSPPAVK